VALRRSQRAERKVAVVIFNFPPNAGNIGSAAYLSVFESMFHTLVAMKAQGYTVDLPASVDALRDAVLQGNAAAARRRCQRAHADPHRRPCAPRALAGRRSKASGARPQASS
jgi:cobalamin biosynthesis Mg chelatase CobN